MNTDDEIPEEAAQAMVNQDWHTAFGIINKLATQGNKNAEHFMGWFYEQGIEVKPSDEKAFQWWMKSAKKGVPESQCAIALLYENGRGIEQNYIEAFFWYSNAIMSGDEESQTFISNLTSKMDKKQLSKARRKLHDQA